MKTLSTLVVILAMFATPSFAGKHRSSDVAVTVLSTKRYVFYFKVEKSFIGATVEVINAEGKVINVEAVMQTKNIVDFFYLEPGKYTIKVCKDAQEYTFAYDNKE